MWSEACSVAPVTTRNSDTTGGTDSPALYGLCCKLQKVLHVNMMAGKEADESGEREPEQ